MGLFPSCLQCPPPPDNRGHYNISDILARL